MNCPNCKNPIQESSSLCEWCGNPVNNNSGTPIINEVQNLNISNKTIIKSKNNITYIIPGIAILFIWVLGNLISERDKHAIFNMDDLSPILIIGLIILVIGLIIKYNKKMKNEK